MENCIFCKIVKGEEKAYKVFEDKFTLAFLDIHQSAPGHTMVVHKKHGLSILDYSGQELKQLFSAVKIVDQKIIKAMGTKTITIGINQFEVGGVPHFHVHLIPRYPNDGGGIIQTIVNNGPKESLDEIAGKIRDVL